MYRLFNIQSLTLEGIYLPAMWVQIPKLLGLFFVVAFGSSLDIAAIQAEMPTPLDFNSELKTVGEILPILRPLLFRSQGSQLCFM